MNARVGSLVFRSSIVGGVLASALGCQARLLEREGPSGGAAPDPSSSYVDLAKIASRACTTEEVRAIFQSNCTSCHDAGSPSGKLDLTGTDPGLVLRGVASSSCPDLVLVKDGSPASSLLWSKLTEATPDCGSSMPAGEAALDVDSLGCIQGWIEGLVPGQTIREKCGTADCIDVQRDPGHCGGCDTSCGSGEACSSGLCVACEPDQTVCTGGCVDTSSDPNNCGACGTKCGAGQVCRNSVCGCDDTPVSFSAEIEPLLNSACALSGCHTGTRAQEGLNLATGKSYTELLTSPENQCSDGRKIVEPSNPGASYLIHKLTGSDMCSGTLMPKKGASLPEADIAKIARWICSGAPNN
jgi:hypothetical protein